MTQPSNLRNPFIGLRSYVFKEQMFGREAEANALLDILIGKRLVLLHSPSGAGKSSLVEANLRPLLKESDIGIEIGLRPWANGSSDGISPDGLYGGIRLNIQPPSVENVVANRFVYSVVSHIEHTRPESERLDIAELSTLDLPAYFERLAKSSASDVDFLHFDQFEEILRLDEGDPDTKKEFFRQLGLALYERRWLVVFSIREEYIGELEPYLRHLPTQLKVRFRIDRLTCEAAGEVIRKTIEPQRSIQPDATKILVDQLAGPSSSFVEPSILQAVCVKLWNSIPSERLLITKADVKDFEVDTALRKFYEDGIETVLNRPQAAATEAELREWFGNTLIVSRVRNTVLRGKDKTGTLPNVAVEQLINVHLVVGEPRRGETWYELTHDRLIDPILDSNGEF
jgi:hypothetical protein